LEGRFRRSVEVPLVSWIRDFVRPRYASLGISVFLAMYVGMKFVLVVFSAADTSERWSFELTPFAAFNLPDLQLAFLSSGVAVSNAFLHSSVQRKHRIGALFVTAAMVASLLLGLRGATTDLNPVNLGRMAILVLLLATVPLDNLILLRTPRPLAEHPIEAELRSMADSDQGAEPVAPAAVVAALRDLEALVNGLPGKAPAPVPAYEDFIETELRSLADRKINDEPVTPSAVTEALKELESLVSGPPADEPTATPAPEKPSTGPADDDYLRRLLASVLEESDAEDRPPRSWNSASSEGEIVLPSEREGLTDELSGQEPAFRSDRVPWLGRYFRRSTEALLADARNLINGGDLDKARKRLDRVVAKGVQDPGSWDLAAALYDRLGEAQKATECRRRARRFSR
jgi:hypothetical protein